MVTVRFGPRRRRTKNICKDCEAWKAELGMKLRILKDFPNWARLNNNKLLRRQHTWSIHQYKLIYNMLIRLLEMRTLRKLIFLVFVKTMVRCTISGWYTSKLYPFGKEAGDSPLPLKDDVSSDAISTPPFHFFELKVESFYVSIGQEKVIF